MASVVSMSRKKQSTDRLPRTIVGMIGLALVATLLGRYEEARSADHASVNRAALSALQAQTTRRDDLNAAAPRPLKVNSNGG
jgi:Mg2+/citrate symporter